MAGLTTTIDPNEIFYQGKSRHPGAGQRGDGGDDLPALRGPLPLGGRCGTPKGSSGKRGGMWLPGTMSVTKHTRNTDEAWELCKWLCDKESGISLAMQRKGSSTPGAGPDVYADPRLLNREGYPPNVGEEQRQAMTEPEPYVTAWNYLGADVNTILGNELDRVTKGELAVNDGFLQNVTAQLQAVLDKPPPRLQ